MYIANLTDMTRGWFVGSFEPTLFQTNEVEAAVKSYHAGECEAAHYHKIATEITVIISGKVSMNDISYCEGDMILIKPGESTDFRALTDVVTTVVKIPGALNDKYMGDMND